MREYFFLKKIKYPNRVKAMPTITKITFNANIKSLRQIQVFLTDYSTFQNTLQQIKYIWSVNPEGLGTAY